MDYLDENQWVVARKKGKLGAVQVKNGKPVGSWKPEGTQKGSVTLSPEKKREFFKKERETGAYIRPEIKKYKPETKAQIDARVQKLNTAGQSDPPPPKNDGGGPLKPPVASVPTRQAPAPAQTGDRTKDLSTWAKANEPMISKVGTPQQRAILAAAKSGSAMPAPRPISKDIKGLKDMQKDSQQSQASQRGPMYSRPEVRSNMSSRTKTMLGLKDSYDIVLDYLLSQGHVDTLEEAHYVMLQMDSKCIQDIVSEQSNTLITPEQRRADELKYGMKRTTAVPPSKPGGTKQKPGSRMPL